MFHYLGMTLTFSGIAMAIFSRKNGEEKISLKLAPKGILFAFGGAIGQALGLVLSKFGMKDYDPFSATQIRIIAGYCRLFYTYITFKTMGIQFLKATKNKKGMQATTLGAFFGPFLGVSFSLLAIKFTETGIASTIMALVPVLIIPPAIFFYKQKISVIEIIGAVISVCGVALFFI